MLKSASANRMTKLKVIEGGKNVKNISNVTINYGQEYEQLKKMLELAIRLSPQDPIYQVEKVYIVNPNDGTEIEINQKELEELQQSLFKPDSMAMANKLSLTVSF